MKRMHVRRLAIILSWAGACKSPEKTPRGTTATPSRTARVPQAEARLDAFLRASLVTEAATKVNFDTLMACVPENATDPLLWLGAYRILGSEQRGDTVWASAEVVTVAEETGGITDAAPRRVMHRVRTDTLNWAMIGDSHGRWGPCGLSREGYDFGSQIRGNRAVFEPPGSSKRTIQASIDSLRRIK